MPAVKKIIYSASITWAIAKRMPDTTRNPNQADGVLLTIIFIHFASGGRTTHAINKSDPPEAIKPEAKTEGDASRQSGK